MPLFQFVKTAGMIHVGQIFIVHRYGTKLIVTGGEHLNKAVPLSLVLVFQITETDLLDGGNILLKSGEAFRQKMVNREVVQRDGFGMDLVHGACRVGNGSDFVGIELFPPIQRGRYVVWR